MKEEEIQFNDIVKFYSLNLNVIPKNKLNDINFVVEIIKVGLLYNNYDFIIKKFKNDKFFFVQLFNNLKLNYKDLFYKIISEQRITNIFSLFSDNIKTDKKLIFKVIIKFPYLIKNVSEKLLKNNFLTKLLKENGEILPFLRNELITDNLFIVALTSNILKTPIDIPLTIYDNENFMKYIIKTKNNKILIPEKIQRNDICFDFIKYNNNDNNIYRNDFFYHCINENKILKTILLLSNAINYDRNTVLFDIIMQKIEISFISIFTGSICKIIILNDYNDRKKIKQYIRIKYNIFNFEDSKSDKKLVIGKNALIHDLFLYKKIKKDNNDLFMFFIKQIKIQNIGKNDIIPFSCLINCLDKIINFLNEKEFKKIHKFIFEFFFEELKDFDNYDKYYKEILIYYSFGYKLRNYFFNDNYKNLDKSEQKFFFDKKFINKCLYYNFNDDYDIFYLDKRFVNIILFYCTKLNKKNTKHYIRYEKIFKNEEILLKLCEHDINNVKYLNYKYKQNTDFIFKLVKINYNSLVYINPCYFNDKDIFIEAIKQNKNAIYFFCKDYQKIFYKLYNKNKNFSIDELIKIMH